MRYIATIELFVYDDELESAQKQIKQIEKELINKYDNNAECVAIHEAPTGSVLSSIKEVWKK